MIRCIQILIYIALFPFLVVGGVQTVVAFPHKIFTIVPTKENKKEKKTPLQVELQEAENGLKISISFAEITEIKSVELLPGEVGGDYLIFLDEIIVINETYTGTSLNVSHDVPLATLQNGNHALRCELRSPLGENHKSQINFIFDGSPVISVTDATVDNAGMLDASVMMNFLGGKNNIPGVADVFIDERPAVNVQLKKEHTGKKTPLLEIAGKPLSTSNLAPGTHLLSLRVHGTNGNSAVSYSSFTVKANPELKIILDTTKVFQEVVATFLKAPHGYSGVVDVFCNQNIVLSKQDQEASISIKRAEIVEGLKKLNRDPLDVPIPLVFSLRAANGAENWQKIDFK